MAITTKPKLKSNETAPPTEEQIQEKRAAEIIRKGGSHAAVTFNEKESSTNLKTVNLRLDNAALTEIDALRNQRRGTKSRHAWLLEAVFEKLEREKNQ